MDRERDERMAADVLPFVDLSTAIPGSCCVPISHFPDPILPPVPQSCSQISLPNLYSQSCNHENNITLLFDSIVAC